MIKKILLLLIFLPYLACPGRADIVDKLTDLNNLYKEGALNEDEFRKVKNKIQSTVGKIQDQLNDKTMIGRY